MVRFLDVKVDVVFKEFFGDVTNKEVLENFINHMLDLTGDDVVEVEEFLDPRKMRVEIGKPTTFVDISVKTKAGERYVIEMQTYNHSGFDKRLLYYLSRDYSEQVDYIKTLREDEIKKKRIGWLNLPKVHIIAVIDFHRSKVKEDGILNGEGVTETYRFIPIKDKKNMETQGNVQVLSSPRVSTVNNQKAVIKVGTDEFFVTDISNTTVTGGGGTTTSPDITLTPFFSGVALDVTPQIDSEGTVVLHIHPTVSEVEDETKVIDLTGETLELPLAVSNVREADSIVSARSGELIVIGGLMNETTKEDIAATPFLGGIPFFGSLFRQTRQDSVKSELVILLRPQVVESPEVWRNSTQRTLDRVNELDRGFHFGSRPGVFGTMGERQSP